MERINFWQAMDRADNWRRVAMQDHERVFKDVAREWLKLAREMRVQQIAEIKL